ncbi:helix-turn-helix transcriptional regulator [Psychroserpens burtonensis]|uniref:Helix-turn-helix transcriptional regulator n=1 Tax=Psychroserpens burtonensis TaxID=49278 RepID=A0A5C7BB94_9FLAO|nr:helix-turn-helix transcriptional regulator [Psychroserpens burtonensis]TXE18344.1 helix-turn-helix transcriptional regulator [Psychroserpens burtonensis]
MDSVIENIKRIRKEKGYSHEYIAHELDISQVAYSKLEKKETKLSVERLYRLAELFEVNVYELLEINVINQFNKEDSIRYSQQLQRFHEENKEQHQKIIQLYEARLRDKDILIEKLEKMIK